MGGGDQLGVAVTLGIVVAVGLALFVLIAWLFRAVWRWIAGSGSKPKGQGDDPKLDLKPTIGASGISASDLFVIRTNLNAVARQVEDLERRLRLAPGDQAKSVETSR
ncbi:hypothetical protein [Microvirga lotononidis]|uniref:Uncharacterized protein n=1 Tax=Microvirga lotononidis TaxID=864069 RepID=I4YWV5_9HYPH|nr:hypothetical protein [Microvirga lotononidis]EIM28447.1 hypothetical protein MicloDRAFT_00050320 [Microvirga lotononidis]WQO27474.1 hypothetical protein U0023_23025 [Microvirga lotononidis]